ncbi:hypothetical protein C8R44DRAFT_347035 [Mycena epipterygia]|nr:hypothetical protein C8R44DRAFT_347035 [Mycena epipterygia]
MTPILSSRIVWSVLNLAHKPFDIDVDLVAPFNLLLTNRFNFKTVTAGTETRINSDRDRVLSSMAILDPVARLPLEISSEIFIRCLPPLPKPGAFQVPMLFLNICNAWTDIALSTPALWASIHVDFPCVQLLGTWLKRARNHSLSISLYNTFDDGVATLVRQHARHIKDLEIYCDEDHLGLLTNIGSFPLLEKLTIGGLPDAGEGPGAFLDLRRTLEILRLAPNLVECTFNDLLMDDNEDVPEKLVLPNLRRMTFGRLEDPTDSDDRILRYLTLPALQALTLQMSGISTRDLTSFFRRSSPPLQTVTLDAGIHRSHFVQSDECLSLLLTLAHFELYSPSTRLVNQLIATLAESPPRLLPALRSMRIHHYDSALSPAAYETLLRALSIRRAQISCFELICARAEPLEPAMDIRAGFRQLVAEGMQIHIGTPDCNFIS